MKKILPPAFIIASFALLLIVQMLVHGQKSSAHKMEFKGEQVIGFENALKNISAKTHTGDSFTLQSIKSPIVVVNFWASWCKPCLKEFPSLNKLNEKYGDQLTIVGINTDNEKSQQKVSKIYDKYELNYPSLMDTSGELTSAFNITKIPATIVFHKGRVIHLSEEEFNFLDKEFLKLIDSKLR